jgi:hypothetical protein
VRLGYLLDCATLSSHHTAPERASLKNCSPRYQRIPMPPRSRRSWDCKQACCCCCKQGAMGRGSEMMTMRGAQSRSSRCLRKAASVGLLTPDCCCFFYRKSSSVGSPIFLFPFASSRVIIIDRWVKPAGAKPLCSNAVRRLLMLSATCIGTARSSVRMCL